MDFLRSPTFARTTVRRLAAALVAGDASALLDAGALAVALVEREPVAERAGRRAAVLLEALLIQLPELTDGVRTRVERALDEALHGDAAATLRALWPAVASEIAPPPHPPSSPIATVVQEFLATRIDERATLGALARELGYSPSHVSALIRRATGRCFTALRRDMRLERARWQLERGAAVKLAALEAGFSDAAYFSRVFRRRFGVPPSAWRG